MQITKDRVAYGCEILHVALSQKNNKIPQSREWRLLLFV